MTIEKARELLKARRHHRSTTMPERDPSATDAYEMGWYALLVQRASGDVDLENLTDDLAAEVAETETEDAEAVAELQYAEAVPEPDHAEAEPEVDTTEYARIEPTPQPTPWISETAPLLRSLLRVHPSEPEPQHDVQPLPPVASIHDRVDAHGNGTAHLPPAPSTIRIGIRQLDDPEAVYREHLTRSLHGDFFRSELWQGSGPITPAHLWRANHLGAGWDIATVRRFMDVAASLADELVASAPHAAQPGSVERRLWMSGLLSNGWVQEFGIGRVSKTLHPMLPELVPDLDATMLSWASGTWLGLDGSIDVEDPQRSLEIFELIEDILVLRGPQLGQIVQRLRHLSPAIEPIGRLGLIQAALWQGYWDEAADAEPPPAEVPPVDAVASDAAEAETPRAEVRPRRPAPRTSRKPAPAKTEDPGSPAADAPKPTQPKRSAKPATKPATKPTVKPTTVASAKPAAKPAAKPVARATPKAAGAVAGRATAKVAGTSVEKPAPKVAAKPVRKATPKVTRPTAQKRRRTPADAAVGSTG